jgi:adenosylcobyric acid synthase
VEGLGLLDVETVLEPEKTVRNVTAWSVIHDEPLSGYEIHLGRTSGPDARRPALIIRGTPDGAISADGRVWGTYLHGVFAADGFRRKMLEQIGVRSIGIDYRDGIEQALDAIAAHLERHIDVEALLAAAR